MKLAVATFSYPHDGDVTFTFDVTDANDHKEILNHVLNKVKKWDLAFRLSTIKVLESETEIKTSELDLKDLGYVADHIMFY